MREQLVKTAFARFWDDPAVQRFLAPAREMIKSWWAEVRQEVSIPEDWQKYFPGEIVLFSPAWHEPGEWEDPPVSLAAEMGLPSERYVELFNEYIKTLPPDAEKSQYTVQGVTVRMIKYREVVEVDEEE